MGFKDTILDMCPRDVVPCEYRLTAFGDGCVYIEGVRCVKSFSGEEIILGMKKSLLKICGRCLRIDKLCGGDAIVCGRIALIERISL